MIKEKDSALARAKRTKSENDFQRARQLRNEVIRRLRTARADYIKNNLQESRGDTKKFWKNISDILPARKSSQRNSIRLTNQTSNDTIPEHECADYINSFFTSIGPELSRTFNTTWKYDSKILRETMADLDCTEEVILKLIRSIDIGKSSGIQGISSRILKIALVGIVDKLTTLFKRSLSSGVFPDKWKQANVVPLAKEGNPTNVSNFRPISLLPLPGKLLETIVHNKIMSFFGEHEVLDSKQGGFRPGFSTTNTIANFTEIIYKAMNNGKLCTATFIDFKKAFDTVDHQILLLKLEKLGIRGMPLQWLTSYLADRTQATYANNLLSNRLKIKCGVPQGSILGPLLFLVFINDLSSCLTSAEASLYADDTVVYTVDVDIEVAITNLQSNLNHIGEWCNRNKLTINVGKTKAMIFGTRNKIKRNRTGKLTLNGRGVDFVTSYKYLGVILDQTLSFNKHINNCIKNVAHKMYLLSKVRPYINVTTSTILYKSMILPYIDYSDIIYEATNTANLRKLQRLQNQCLRICARSRDHIPTTELHCRYKVGVLESRRQAHLNNYMFKQQNNTDLVDQRMIRTRAHNGTLFKVEYPYLEKYKQSTYYRGALLWNGLSAATRNIASYTSFKLLQKRLMLSNNM